MSGSPGTVPKMDSAVLNKEPETKPISQEQLIAEVKGIYAGLAMVENKCIEVDDAQETSPNQTSIIKFNNEQWQALISLHRTLLHEHHDFFLASQHSSASPALRRLASKYAMPARMWRHGIHSFLELLRHRLPASREHMLTFIYLAYSMMALLYEDIPAFEDTWTDCLGDLGRYRMAIEDENATDREVWNAVSRQWYDTFAKRPHTGRLYHHLAILARPDALRQLHYFTASLRLHPPIPGSSLLRTTGSIFDLIPDKTTASSSRSRLGAAQDGSHLLTHPCLTRRSMYTDLEPVSPYLDYDLFQKVGKDGRSEDDQWPPDVFDRKPDDQLASQRPQSPEPGRRIAKHSHDDMATLSDSGGPIAKDSRRVLPTENASAEFTLRSYQRGRPQSTGPKHCIRFVERDGRLVVKRRSEGPTTVERRSESHDFDKVAPSMTWHYNSDPLMHQEDKTRDLNKPGTLLDSPQSTYEEALRLVNQTSETSLPRLESPGWALAHTTLAFISHFFDGRHLPPLATGPDPEPGTGRSSSVVASAWNMAHIDWPNGSCQGHRGIYAVERWVQIGLAWLLAWLEEVFCWHFLPDFMSALQIGLEGVVGNSRQPRNPGRGAGRKKQRARLPLQRDPYLLKRGEISRSMAGFSAACWSLPRFGT